MESDSQEVVNLISRKKSTRIEIFWVVAEVQDRIKRLKQVKMQYTPRKCNSVAHSLAKLALELNDFVFWDDIPTQFLYLFTELNSGYKDESQTICYVNIGVHFIMIDELGRNSDRTMLG